MNFSQRINNIQELIRKNKVNALLVSSTYYITYLTGYSNFSIEQREAFLFITPTQQYIITDGRYCTAIKQLVSQFELIEIESKADIQKIINQLSNQHKVKVLGIEEDSLTLEESKNYLKSVLKIKHVPLHYPRSIKDPEELNRIKQACHIGDQAFKYIQTHIEQGITEQELAFELELFIRKQGAKISFEPIVAFGKNSAIPHHHTGKTKLEKNQFVLLDFGVKYQNYCSDMTRTVFLGKPSKEQTKMYQVVLEAHEKAVEYIQNVIRNSFQDLPPSSSTRAWMIPKQALPAGRQVWNDNPKMTNLKAEAVDKIARDYIISQGYTTMPHSLGHGIGLQVHERPYISPKSQDILKPGMVFSIEPGIYIPEYGGVRIEDLYMLEHTSLIKLTKSVSKLIPIPLSVRSHT